jgi:hypothetical protein
MNQKEVPRRIICVKAGIVHSVRKQEKEELSLA